MRRYTCDHCDADMDEVFIAVQYPIVGDDDEVDDEEAHLCSWPCLSSWATATALDQPLEEQT